jgi:anti-sigma regulatory factor (Ser/Thr protein kinase)
VNVATREGLRHAALLYRDAAEYLAGTLPFIRGGLAAGEPVAVAVPSGNLELLGGALGADARQVHFQDMTVAGRNPGAIIPTLLHAFADEHAGRPVRVVGEPIWAGRSALEYPACAQHEALINTALADRSVAVVCPYNTAVLGQTWIDDARKTHPVLFTAERCWTSRQYADPVTVASGFNRPLPCPPADAATISVDLHGLPVVRRFVAGHAAAAGLTAARVAEATFAVNELAANAVEHGGGTGLLAVWAQRDCLIYQLSDAGHLTDPLAGRRPMPMTTFAGGRGLLLVNQLCDFVRTYTCPAGTTTRVHIRR